MSNYELVGTSRKTTPCVIHLDIVNELLLARDRRFPVRVHLMWCLVYRYRTVPVLFGFALANLGSLCLGPPRHLCLQPPHVVDDCTVFTSFSLLLVAPVFLAWHCAFHASAFRCHREISATLEVGTCAGSPAWNFFTSPSSLWHPRISAVFLFVRWVPHCFGRFVLSITEPRRLTRNFH